MMVGKVVRVGHFEKYIHFIHDQAFPNSTVLKISLSFFLESSVELRVCVL